MTTPAAPAKPAEEQQHEASQTHWQAQLALVALIVADLQNTYQWLEVEHPERVPKFTFAVSALVTKYGHISGTLAADYYEEARIDAGIVGPFHAIPAAVPIPDQVDASIRWGAKDLWGPEPDVTAVHTKIEGAVDKMVLDTGRNTVADNVIRDEKAHGFARQGRADCCAFCAMLISRGAVYKTRESAEFRSSDGRAYHDHCHCTVDPFWGPAHKPTAQEHLLREQWDQYTRGYSGTDALNAFRRGLGRN